MGDLVQMRDFKRREEVRQMSDKARKILDQVHYHDTAPSEILMTDLTAFDPGHPVEIGLMPPVQPTFTAPTSDPA